MGWVHYLCVSDLTLDFFLKPVVAPKWLQFQPVSIWEWDLFSIFGRIVTPFNKMEAKTIFTRWESVKYCSVNSQKSVPNFHGTLPKKFGKSIFDFLREKSTDFLRIKSVRLLFEIGDDGEKPSYLSSKLSEKMAEKRFFRFSQFSRRVFHLESCAFNGRQTSWRRIEYFLSDKNRSSIFL